MSNQNDFNKLGLIQDTEDFFLDYSDPIFDIITHSPISSYEDDDGVLIVRDATGDFAKLFGELSPAEKKAKISSFGDKKFFILYSFGTYKIVNADDFSILNTHLSYEYRSNLNFMKDCYFNLLKC